MGKYELKKLYTETDVEPPKDLAEGDTIWSTISRTTQDGSLMCINPINFGQDLIRVDHYPKIIADLPIFSESGGLNSDLTKIPVFIEIVHHESGFFKGKIVDESEWPDLKNEEVHFKTNRQESIKWDGTPQQSGSAGSKRRSDILSEEDIRSSKNDLIS